MMEWKTRNRLRKA